MHSNKFVGLNFGVIPNVSKKANNTIEHNGILEWRNCTNTRKEPS